MMITPVILSGGIGTRLWPLSRKQHPKQYLPLFSDKTMLQETLLRLDGLDNVTDPIIVCNSEHRFLVAEQCQQIKIENPIILLEPVGRNTAPAITAAAFQSLKSFDDTVLLVLSADHVVQDIDEFHRVIHIATKKAQEGSLVTLGVIPTDANTGYGYIKFCKNNIDNDVFEVDEFVEKPDLKTAKSYLEQGSYFWNAGMFVFKANIFIDELTLYSSDIIFSASNAVKNSTQDYDFIRLNKQDFLSSPSESIDYALMEKSRNVVVVPLNAKWSDVGTWSALYDYGKKDNSNNVIKGNVVSFNTTNTYINSNHHMVAAVGVDNLIIVNTPDVTFIANQDNVHEVKNIFESLKADSRNEVSMNQKVYRPWGWYDSISSGANFQVKKIYINPGAKLSLQMHYKRSEHWIVVSGVAKAIVGEEVIILNKDESTYIPIETPHSLENNMDEPLELIEVQSGTYFGEDDIVRFEDIYGRIKNNSEE